MNIPSWCRLAPLCITLVVTLLAGCSSVDPIRPTQPVRGSLAEKDLACIKKAGFDAEQQWDGSLAGVGSMSSEQAEKWVAAANVCGTKTHFFDPKLSASQVNALYIQEVEERDCLLDIGLNSPLPPSEADYATTWNTADQYYAYQSAGGFELGVQKAKSVVRKCPPPTWFLDLPGL
jgi:hypothetical protein